LDVKHLHTTPYTRDKNVLILSSDYCTLLGVNFLQDSGFVEAGYHQVTVLDYHDVYLVRELHVRHQNYHSGQY
jgi:hypothetical protein